MCLDDCEVLKSTVTGIWKQCEKIKFPVSSSDCPALALKCCIIREGQLKKLDEDCFTCMVYATPYLALCYRGMCCNFFQRFIQIQMQNLLKLALDGFTAFTPVSRCQPFTLKVTGNFKILGTLWSYTAQIHVWGSTVITYWCIVDQVHNWQILSYKFFLSALPCHNSFIFASPGPRTWFWH